LAKYQNKRDSHVFYFYFVFFFKLGLTSLYRAGPGLASLAWSLAQASNQPGPSACMNYSGMLCTVTVIILQAGKNKRGYLVQLEAKRRLATKTM
jgi:hypothetical protein